MSDLPELDEPFDDGIARANWSVPWADLMMVMFVLLAAVFALHSQEDARKRHDPASPRAALPVLGEVEVKEEVIKRSTLLEPPVRINVLARSEQAAREANLQNAEIVLMDDDSVKVSVQGPMFFELGRAELRPEVTDFLRRLAQVIRETPYDIHVVGHTDDLPIATAQFPSNWELSLARASQVARYLIGAGGVDPARFVVMGRGQYEPVAQNADAGARARFTGAGREGPGVERDVAAPVTDEAHQRLEQRGLAGAVSPQKRRRAARLDAE